MLWLGLLLTLSGCFSTTVDDLYCPPKLPQNYVQLDARINALLAERRPGGTPRRYSFRTWTATGSRNPS